ISAPSARSRTGSAAGCVWAPAPAANRPSAKAHQTTRRSAFGWIEVMNNLVSNRRLDEDPPAALNRPGDAVEPSSWKSPTMLNRERRAARDFDAHDRRLRGLARAGRGRVGR